MLDCRGSKYTVHVQDSLVLYEGVLLIMPAACRPREQQTTCSWEQAQDKAPWMDSVISAPGCMAACSRA